MPNIEYEVSQEPVGVIVYISVDGIKLSLGKFCDTCGLELLEVANIMKVEGGFQAEPADGLAFFLFQERADAFVESMKEYLKLKVS